MSRKHASKGMVVNWSWYSLTHLWVFALRNVNCWQDLLSVTLPAAAVGELVTMQRQIDEVSLELVYNLRIIFVTII